MAGEVKEAGLQTVAMPAVSCGYAVESGTSPRDRSGHVTPAAYGQASVLADVEGCRRPFRPDLRQVTALTEAGV
jgi:hypothetical protein